MREVTIEFDGWECPSNNQVRSMNKWVYKKLIDNLKIKILHQIGEGPWPKITFERGAYHPAIRQQTLTELKEKWAPPRIVMADVTMRRNKRYDNDNSQGGAKPMWDAFTRMGWMVDDHEKWFVPIHRPQVIGDPKVIITFHLPQNDRDEKRIREMFNSVSSMLDKFKKKGKS